MKRIFLVIVLVFTTILVNAQTFNRSTTTETLKEQTMMFELEFDEDKSISLTLWGESTGLGAVLELVDMTKSPKPEAREMQYEIINNNSLYLLLYGEKIVHVVFRNDYAYLYLANEDELWVKIPRIL